MGGFPKSIRKNMWLGVQESSQSTSQHHAPENIHERARMLSETASGTVSTKLCQNASRKTLESLLRGLHESFPAVFSEELGGSVPEAFPATLPGSPVAVFPPTFHQSLVGPFGPLSQGISMDFPATSRWTSASPVPPIQWRRGKAGVRLGSAWVG